MAFVHRLPVNIFYCSCTRTHLWGFLKFFLSLKIRGLSLSKLPEDYNQNQSDYKQSRSQTPNAVLHSPVTTCHFLSSNDLFSHKCLHVETMARKRHKHKSAHNCILHVGGSHTWERLCMQRPFRLQIITSSHRWPDGVVTSGVSLSALDENDLVCENVTCEYVFCFHFEWGGGETAVWLCLCFSAPRTTIWTIFLVVFRRTLTVLQRRATWTFCSNLAVTERADSVQIFIHSDADKQYET